MSTERYCSTEEIERRADGWLKVLNITSSDRPDMLSVLHTLLSGRFKILDGFDLLVVPDSQMGEMEACEQR